MKPKLAYELWKWSYFVMLFLVGTAIGMLVVEIIAAPLLRWLLYDIPYALPSWDYAKRWALGILFIGFFAGTLSWYAEKRSSGR